MLSQLFFEKNLVHNLVWNKIQQDDLISSCVHWPTYEVTPAIRKLCKIQNLLSKQTINQAEVVAKDILMSGNIIELFTKLCDEIFVRVSNSHLIALIYVTSEIAKYYLQSHKIIQINCIINVLQLKISSYRKQHSNKLGLCIVLSAFALLFFLILIPEKF